MGKLFFVVVLLTTLLLHHHHHRGMALALPLSTNSRWIVDSSGNRVKLACVNWVAHLDAVVAEGLSKQPVDVISKKILEMGFNCVRLTWPVYLAVNDTLASTTVRQSFQNLGLKDDIAGLEANNPSFLDLTIIQAYKTVVASLEKQKVMVILDNHISKPGWCCSDSDGNGFFGDTYFSPDQWIDGLTRIATIFKSSRYVVAMSIRNELRGKRQNLNDWYRYMQQGAEAVHSANPDVLVILSGLNYDNDLSFLGNRQVNLSFTGKLVYELHWYSFSDGNEWAKGNPNHVCAKIVKKNMKMAGFLLDKGYPLFVSEFGIDQRGTNTNDNRYFNCFSGFAADLDLDWALWTLVGSYYIRENLIGLEEFYGTLTRNWSSIRNPNFLQKISALQSPFQGPGLTESRRHKVIYHPLTGMCIKGGSVLDPLKLVACNISDAWDYSSQKVLTIDGTYLCLQADDKSVKLGMLCSKSSAKWDQISDSKMHLSTKLGNGISQCLDVDMTSNTIITRGCKCLSGDSKCNPASQWFKIINSTVVTTTTTTYSTLFPFFNSFFNSLGRLF